MSGGFKIVGGGTLVAAVLALVLAFGPSERDDAKPASGGSAAQSGVVGPQSASEGSPGAAATPVSPADARKAIKKAAEQPSSATPSTGSPKSGNSTSGSSDGVAQPPPGTRAPKSSTKAQPVVKQPPPGTRQSPSAPVSPGAEGLPQPPAGAGTEQKSSPEPVVTPEGEKERAKGGDGSDKPGGRRDETDKGGSGGSDAPGGRSD